MQLGDYKVFYEGNYVKITFKNKVKYSCIVGHRVKKYLINHLNHYFIIAGVEGRFLGKPKYLKKWCDIS